MNAKTLLMLILLTYIINQKGYAQQDFEFEYPDFEVTVYPTEPGICPGKTANVLCVEDFDSYKWELLGSGPTSGPWYGKEQELTEPGQYMLTVEKTINNTLCSEQISFKVHDLGQNEGIEKYLLGNGFHPIPIFVDVPGLKDQSAEDRNSPIFNPFRFHEAYEFLNWNEEILNSIVQSFKPFAEVLPEEQGIVHVESNNKSFCTDGIVSLENEFNSGGVSFWIHQFVDSETSTEGTLYIKGNLPFEGEMPKTQAHSNHLSTIFDEVINDAQNNIDAAKATYEHLRVFVSNLFMPNPTGGYTLENECSFTLDEFEGNHFFTPGQVAVQVTDNLNNLFFDSDFNSTSFGSLIKFDYADKVWQNYHRLEDFTISNGYFNPINAEFYENFTTSISECIDCAIDIVSIGQGCSNYNCTLETDKYTTEFFNLDAVSDGGFNYEMSTCVRAWNPWPISKRSSRQLIYNLLCAIKSGDTTFEFDNKFKNKVIAAKDIRLGNQKYEYVAVTMPKQSNIIQLLPKPSHNSNGTVAGFISSFDIAVDDEVRLNFFQFTADENGEKTCKSALKTNYSYPKWESKFATISSCLPYYDYADKLELLDYLSPPDQDNLLIMVNGYRIFKGNPGKKWYKGGVEYPAPDPEDAVNSCFDDYEDGSYWGDMGTKFIDRINENVLYVDGHHSITTSNHIKMLPTPEPWNIDFASSIASCCLLKFLCNDWTCKLNTTPNPIGFLIRYANGFSAGQEIWQRMVAGDIKVKLNPAKTAILGKIDVVAHSMGYAYSKGMLDYLEYKLAPGNTFGRYYIIAPENAEVYTDEEFNNSDQGAQDQVSINFSYYEDVFQYGSNFTENGDPKCKQDGVAPQSRVRGLPLNNFKNVFIPDNYSKIKNFIDAHLMDNQGWIFEISFNDKGYIKKRE